VSNAVTLTLLTTDTWVAFYIDGEKKAENHSLRPWDILTHLEWLSIGFFEQYELNEDAANENTATEFFPDELTEEHLDEYFDRL